MTDSGMCNSVMLYFDNVSLLSSTISSCDVIYSTAHVFNHSDSLSVFRVFMSLSLLRIHDFLDAFELGLSYNSGYMFIGGVFVSDQTLETHLCLSGVFLFSNMVTTLILNWLLS